MVKGPILWLLAKVVLGLFVGLFAFDRGLAWFDAKMDLTGSALARDPELAWVNKPGYTDAVTTISSIGMRSPEIPDDAPKDEVLVIGVGASRFFGAGDGGPPMDKVWAPYLEQLCKAKYGERWRVLNGAVNGYSAVQAARRAVKLIPELRPDLILMEISPGSQMMLDPSSTRHYVHVGKGDDEVLLPIDIANAVPEPLYPAAALLHQTLTHSAIYTRYRAKASDQGRRAKEIDKFVLSRAPRPPEIEPTLQRTFDELRALGIAAREAGVELRAVVMPEPYMDHPARWKNYTQNHGDKGAPPVGTPREEPLEVLTEVLTERGIESYSMLQPITQIGTDRDKYNVDEGHWKSIGHELIARAIFLSMVREGLPERLMKERAAHPRN
ncbi:MAG: SGNH/GDSL hydrolase family protein [Planctomycetota bacterium]|nr:MAG: SGNH/GDSL hydrolase family protein [Planctomycetota bacterium]